MNNISQAKINQINGAINEASIALAKAKNLLKDLESLTKTDNNNDDKPGIYGTFLGDHMLGEAGEKFDVPENYASKSILVYGDKLKMMDEEGVKKFKQVERVKRNRIEGVLAKKEGKWHVVTSDGSYRVLDSAVEHFKGSEGDLVVVLLPGDNKFAPFAAIESISLGVTEAPKHETIEVKPTPMHVVSTIAPKAVEVSHVAVKVSPPSQSKSNSAFKRKPSKPRKPDNVVKVEKVEPIQIQSEVKPVSSEPSKALTDEDLR